ncbi:efflux RND transporter permease subunit [Thiotrichales bacterium 19S3-7]|nr:efflux RND transporter permease subunit [Thiotrichales bacterium 19S3-7]MCF6800626.1 efflux RND transporter permease subunit [Thiotrichales bacterium 19S3-11]
MKLNNGVIAFFVQHKVAANLLMFIMIASGIFGLYKLNTQFLPNLEINYITVTVPWVGASAADVERSIIVPLEKELRDLDNLKTFRAIAKSNVGTIVLEFNEKTNMAQAYQDTQQRVSNISNLPSESEKPIISKIERYEPVAKIIISGSDSLETMRKLAYEYEHQLLQLGIAKINILGLPKLEFAVKVSQEQLYNLHMTLPEIAKVIDQHSSDSPLGSAGENDVARDLRFIKAVRDIESIAAIPISDPKSLQVTTIGDIAEISLEKQDGETTIYYNGQPAIELQLLRTSNDSTLKMAKTMFQWYENQQASAKDLGINLIIYDQRWTLIKDRILLLVKNGLTGLAFIIIVLMLFLNLRVAFWVALGIPISCFATFYILYLSGDSINMVSLFAIIMTLGIIVDDTIVVGENAYREYCLGQRPYKAAILGARRMLKPVLASSLTTIAAFLPLMLVSDVIGQVLIAIPVVVICVIIASLVECFLVLPNHLKSSFREMRVHRLSKYRLKLDGAFEYFRDVYFYRLLTLALKWRYSVIIFAVLSIILTISLLVGRHVPFTFFKMPDSNIIKLNAVFVPGTKEEKIHQYLNNAQTALIAIANQQKKIQPNEPNLVEIITQVMGQTADLRGDQRQRRGDNVGHLNVELSMPDDRSISNDELIRKWRLALHQSDDIEQLIISSPVGGPPGRDIDIRLSGNRALKLKEASEYIRHQLSQYKGVKNISDNLPYGKEQWIFELKPSAIAQGVNVKSLAQQVSAGYSRALVQRITDDQDEIDVSLSLTDIDQDSLIKLENFPIKLPNGSMVPLHTLINIKAINGFDRMIHQDGQMVVNVTAEVDSELTNANDVLNAFSAKVLSKLKQNYQVNYSLKGKSEEQEKTFSDMLIGLVIGLILIYIILALFFSSYSWPLMIMSVIPLGIVGAIIGHLLLGYDMTILSLFGLFGLSGIIVNDSIILLSFYKEKRISGMIAADAIIEATKTRLRPVLLTSVTTIVGLLPLLFETSLQAKFLIPMAISIVFGLLFTTLLILFLLPCMLTFYERINPKSFEK